VGSILAWVYQSGTVGAHYLYLVAGSTGGQSLLYGGDVGGVNCCWSGQVSGSPRRSPLGLSIGVGAWHQVVGTYDGANATWYQDGVPIGTTTYSPTANWDAITGTWDGPWIGFNWAGWIDHLLMWNRMLSAAEVASLYADPFQFTTYVP
jgi:hypothetical protein